MSLISISFGRLRGKQSIYDLVDSKFGNVEVVLQDECFHLGSWVGIGVGIAAFKFYSERNLPIAKNLALLLIHEHRKYGCELWQLKCWQDEHCSKYVSNWDQYIEERDRQLEKLLALL